MTEDLKTTNHTARTYAEWRRQREAALDADRWPYRPRLRQDEQKEVLAFICFDADGNRLTGLDPSAFDHRGTTDWHTSGPGVFERIAEAAYRHWDDAGAAPGSDLLAVLDEEAAGVFVGLEPRYSEMLGTLVRPLSGARWKARDWGVLSEERILQKIEASRAAHLERLGAVVSEFCSYRENYAAIKVAFAARDRQALLALGVDAEDVAAILPERPQRTERTDDKRQRILAALSEGKSAKAVAKDEQCSEQWVHKVKREAAEAVSED